MSSPDPLQPVAEAVRIIAADLRSRSPAHVAADPSGGVESTCLQRSLKLAALGTVVLAVGMALRGYSAREAGWQYYSTSVGEYRVVRLSDASTVDLDARSRIGYRDRHGIREIELISGQARFSVVHDQARPFVVFVGDTVVRDVGTEFTVRMGPNSDVRVIVERGEVALTHQAARGMLGRLFPRNVPLRGGVSAQAGVQVDNQGGRLSLRKISASEMEERDAWRGGKISFEDMTLTEIVEELNRYSSERIVIAGGPAVAQTKFSGRLTVSSRDIGSALQNLKHLMEQIGTPIAVTEARNDAGGVVMEIRGASGN